MSHPPHRLGYKVTVGGCIHIYRLTTLPISSPYQDDPETQRPLCKLTEMAHKNQASKDTAYLLAKNQA
jgi:hypothetical protein